MGKTMTIIWIKKNPEIVLKTTLNSFIYTYKENDINFKDQITRVFESLPKTNVQYLKKQTWIASEFLIIMRCISWFPSLSQTSLKNMNDFTIQCPKRHVNLKITKIFFKFEYNSLLSTAWFRQTCQREKLYNSHYQSKLRRKVSLFWRKKGVTYRGSRAVGMLKGSSTGERLGSLKE